MADIIGVYNESRINNRDNPKGVLDQVFAEKRWQNQDLEHLATHLTNCVANGIYLSREAIYPIIDLESMVQLKKEKRINIHDNTLQAVYHLLDDYLLPEKQQQYKFNAYQAGAIVQAAIDLGLAKDFDINYVGRIIEQAERGNYSNLVEGRRVISMLVDKKIAVERAQK